MSKLKIDRNSIELTNIPLNDYQPEKSLLYQELLLEDIPENESKDYSYRGGQSLGGVARENMTSRKLFYENRKQNQLLISINCSKAVDNQNYKEQANLIRHQQQQLVGSLRSQSIVESNKQVLLNQARGSINIHHRQKSYNTSFYGTNPHTTHHNNFVQIDELLHQNNQSRATRISGDILTQFRISNQKIQEMRISQDFKQSKRDRGSQLNKSVNLNSTKINVLPNLLKESPEKQSNNRKSQQRVEKDSILENTDSLVDSSKMFIKNKHSEQKVMYNRAMNKLRNFLRYKGYLNTTLEQSNYGLYHFHIDTQDNEIKLNKFETNPSQNNSFMMNNNSSGYESKDLNSKFKLNEDSLKIDLDQVNEVKKMKRQETEDYISNDLIKNSPAFRQIQRKRTIKNDQFSMNIKPTSMALDNDFSSREVQAKREANQQKTILYIKEVDDNERDFLNMELKEFIHLSIDELQQAYNRLIKAVNPVFSGSVDTLVNRLDSKKIMSFNDTTPGSLRVKAAMQQQQQQEHHSYNEIESNLLNQLKTCREQLDKKKLVYGMWSILGQQGSIPDSREGATAIMVDNNLYIFGGFSRDLFNDMRVFDLHTQRWRLVRPSQSPHQRFAHSMTQYGNKLFIFGGAGPYIASIKMRLSFNDVQVFDMDKEIWLKEPDIEGAPKKRQNHICGSIGPVMIVQGGFNTESKKVLSDFGLFDMENLKWLAGRVYFEGERIDDKTQAYDEFSENILGFRQMHSATTVVDTDFYRENPQMKHSKFIWMHKRPSIEEDENHGNKYKNFDEGIYIFGGQNQQNHALNDLWLIEPFYDENQKNLNPNTFEYVTKPTLAINIRKIDDIKGKPPCPRIQHQATLFKDWNNHNLLVIYGGRNDGLFAKTQNVAMNDICIFNVNKKEWQVLAMYGQMPCSRWSHILTMNGSARSDGFLVFGGVNLKSYCKSRIYQFQIWNQWYKHKKNLYNHQNTSLKEPDEKYEMLNNNVKDKIDIIKDLLIKPKKQNQ